MRSWPTLFLASLLLGQVPKPVANPDLDTLAQHLKPGAIALSPQQMIRAMVALDQAQRKQSGAIVEVIGYDEESALHLRSQQVAEQVRQEFRAMDKHSQRELYAFMHQDPNRPGPVLVVPLFGGAAVSHAEDKWLR